MALICGDLTLVTCIEQLLGLDHFLCALLMFYHADFYSKCSVVGPVPQQRPLELQVFALPCCSCSGKRSSSAVAAWQVQCWQLTRNIEEHRILEAVQGDTRGHLCRASGGSGLTATGAPGWSETGVPEVWEPVRDPSWQQWGLLPTELVAPMESWGRWDSSRLWEEGLGEKTNV